MPEARMKNPVLVLPDALQALLAVDKSTHVDGLPDVTRKLIHLRASQINGCSMCVDMHAKEMKQAKETDERIFGVAAWREMPYFTEAERAALDLTESATRLADRSEAVSDEVWSEAAKHYDERALSALIVQIALINAFNRLNAVVKMPVGSWN